jgi:hypothetical protein
MARRATGPKAPAGSSPIAKPKVPAGPAPTRTPAPAGKPAATGKPTATRKPTETGKPAVAGKPATPERSAGAAAPRLVFPRLVGLRVAAGAEALEAAGLAVAAVFAAVSTAEGRSYQLVGGIAATLIALGTAAGLAALATCLAMAKPWTRIPTVITQLFVIIVGITLLQGHRTEWGVPALVLAGACVAGLATPATIKALNRPPVKPQTAPESQEGR